MLRRRNHADVELDLALDKTTESWKRGLLVSARHSSNRERWVLRVALASLVVAVASLVVALAR